MKIHNTISHSNGKNEVMAFVCCNTCRMQGSDKLPPGYRNDIFVGGKRFVAHESTLRKIPYFAAMLDRFPDSALVADRDPRGFRHILNYARDSSYRVPSKWAPEVAFYGLDAVALVPTAQTSDSGSCEWYRTAADRLTNTMQMNPVGGDVFVCNNNVMVFGMTEPINPAKCTRAQCIHYIGAGVEPVSIVMERIIAKDGTVASGSVILDRAYIRLLHSLIPTRIKTMLANLESMCGIRTVVLPGNYNIRFTVKFSGVVDYAIQKVLGSDNPGVFPCYGFGDIFTDKPRPVAYRIGYDPQTDEFVPLWVSIYKDFDALQVMLYDYEVHQSTGLPFIRTAYRGHTETHYYFLMADNAFSHP